MSEDLKSKSVLVYDHGLFVELALRLARDYGKVYYFNPIERSCPSIQDHCTGDGFDELQLVDSIWSVADDTDLFVFPDVQAAPLQKHLESMGKRVWGSRNGDMLELKRAAFKEVMANLGMAVGDYEVIEGLDKLRDYLKVNEDKFIKVSKYRGDMESWHHVTYELSQVKLDQLACRFGPLQNDIKFIVEDPIETNIECYDKETEILTEYGWKKHDELRPEYALATLNPNTGNVEYHRPNQIIRRNSDNIFKGHGQKWDLAVTENHNLILSKMHDVSTLHRMRLCDMGDHAKYQCHCSGQWPGVEVQEYVVPPIPSAFDKRKIGQRPIAIPMDRWLSFLGWFISEGSITRDGYTIIITQANCHKIEIDKISQTLDGLPFKWNRNGANFRLNSKQLYMHLLALFRRTKRIPSFVKRLSPRQIRIVLDGIFDGDGTTASNGVTKIYCVGPDKLLADDIQECLMKCGVSGSVISKAPQKTSSYIGSRRINRTRVTYLVSEHKISRHVIKKENFHEEPYNDVVWCVNVTNHIVYVRRNGKAMWCGNCGYDGFCVDGQFPGLAMQGYESKDRGLIASVMEYDDLPEEIRDVNKALSGILKEARYRNFFSTEIRVDGEPYLIDPTCREPCPSGEIQQEIWGNLSQIIWEGSVGNLIDPEPTAKFGVEVIIEHKDSSDGWRVIHVPDHIKQWVKLFGACKIGNLYAIPPQPHLADSIGAVVGLGDTIEDAIDDLNTVVDSLGDQPITIDRSALMDTLKVIEEAEEKGIEFTDQKVPKPEEVMQ